MPNIRALAAAGVLVRSQSVFPTMTHPAHTSLITGTTPRQHGVVNNRVVDRRTGERLHITNLRRRESVAVPTLFDALHARGLRTAALFWPETKDDPSIDDNFTEAFAGDGIDVAAVAPGLLTELRQAQVPIDSFFALYDDPFTQGAADVVLTKAAVHILKKRQPALLALHLMVADKAQHEFGADHHLSRAALTAADYCVGMLRRAVADAGLTDRTTFVIAADHGFVTVRDELNIGPPLRQPALEGRVRWQADGWYAWGELLPTSIGRATAMRSNRCSRASPARRASPV
jgi:predicted AlkP superfamily pyrophosphatase or phosphodiesterase